MELPTTRQQVTDYNPSLMVLFGKPKSGKSTLMAALEGNLILDLEDGYRSLPVMRVRIRNAKDLLEVKKEIVKKAKELGKLPYKYITIDNATRLEEMALPVAADLYRNTSMGANWQTRIDEKTGQRVPNKDADVRLLPNGSGYLYLRNAVKRLIGMFLGLCDTLILVAHVKEKQIRKDAEEVSELSVDLAGKLADIICGEADAVGLVYREKNKTYISFKGGDGTLKEARPLHLRGNIFEVASSDDNNRITVDLSKIFI
jgi:hypothetical protein